MSKPLYACPECGLPMVVASTSKPGTFVCRACRARFNDKPKQFKTHGHGGFVLGIIASAVIFTVVLFLMQPRQPSHADSEIKSVASSSPKMPTVPLDSPPISVPAPKVSPLVPSPSRETPAVLSARQIYDAMNLSVITVVSLDESGKRRATGTGFAVSNDGLIATNLHVLEGSTFVDIESTDGWRARSTGFVSADGEVDLAIIKIDHPTIKVRLGSSLPNIGIRVYAIGNPEGFQNTVSEGIVSGRRKSVDIMGDLTCQLIQTTTAISHGSSGGPLIGENGDVIGVTSSYWVEGQNINFAIPSTYVKSMLDSLAAPRDFEYLPKLLKSRIIE